MSHLGKRPEELQLKEGPYSRYEEVLHGNLPSTWEELFEMMDAMDYVVREWGESMIPFGFTDMAEEISQELYAENMNTRFAIFSFLDEESDDKMDFIEVMKQMNTLKQAYVPLAKSYAKVPSLSHWYLNLPIRIASAFKSIRQIERERARLKLESERGGLFK